MKKILDPLPWDRCLRHGVLLAVSGGADSTALLHFAARAAKELEMPSPAVGHVDHGLRGEESDGDALFVRNLTSEYGLRFFEHRIEPDAWALDESGSREAAARTIRYEFLTRTAEENGMRYVATAHTADDQTETVLHRILRGTGLSGLAGMSRFRQLSDAVTLVRPLLDLRRNEILDYLRQIDKPFRIDSTNLEDEFTRNRIRRQLLPFLREDFNPKVDAALLRLSELATENEAVLDDLIDELTDRVVLRQTAEEIVLDAKKLRERHPATLRELFVRLWRRRGWPLREMGFEQWNDLVVFSSAHESGRRALRGGIVVERRDGTVIFRAKK